MSEQDSQVDLASCDREPIHIPGLIQPHGCLLAFDSGGALIGFSVNATGMLDIELRHGMSVAALGLDQQGVHGSLVAETIEASREGRASSYAVETTLNGQPADLVVHSNGSVVIAEWELRNASADGAAGFALKAHRMIDRLRRSTSLQEMLVTATEQVRALTGFDRVMAYQFRHDDSGEVVAEAREQSLEPYLGLRYPASDIPVQARQLYVLNTLRLISDVNYQAVPVKLAKGQPPLDMSQCVLRSVSPVHLEYLGNMGVAASMSISIVVRGKLWGLIACHHMTPRHVGYALRIACDVLASVLTSLVISIVATQESGLVKQAAACRALTMESVLHGDDVLASLQAHEADLCASLLADAIIFTERGRILSSAGVDLAAAAAIVQSLSGLDGGGLVSRVERVDWAEPSQLAIGEWIGLLALPFHPAGNGWVIFLRRERLQILRWGGNPEKHLVPGPLGPRLTPRGSFSEWCEVAPDQGRQWTPVEQDIAQTLLGELQRAVSLRYAESDRVRTLLMAMLGHDLRDPLSSIRMAGALLQEGSGEPRLGKHIINASGRMQRLITDVMDLSRISSGIGLGLHLRDTDLSALVAEFVSESSFANPGSVYQSRVAPGVVAHLDADRISQVLSNLLSNARHHGASGEPILVDLQRDGTGIELQVSNVAEAIDPALAATLFSPFKHSAKESGSNRTGLGLGLFIAHEIIAGHGGTLQYRYQAPHVVFVVRLGEVIG